MLNMLNFAQLYRMASFPKKEFITALALLLIGVALASCSVTKTSNAAGGNHPTATPNQPTGPKPTFPAAWHTLHDPAQSFTLRVPADWQMKEDGGYTYGDSKLGISIDSVKYRFAAPTSAVPPPLYFDVSVGIYKTSQQRHLLCVSPPGNPNTTFHGLPAEELGGPDQWYVYAQNAYFMLNDYYPGEPLLSRGNGPNTTPTPTPPPADAANAKAIIDMIRDSFTPQPNKPLACP
jgi:hypothetical protein